jgi:iron complex outermembrane receptor protein
VTEARINTPAFQPPFGPLILPALIGDPNLRSETLNAYELGYRIQPAPRISIDVATFYNVYDELHMLMAGPPRPELEPPPPHLLLPLNWENSGEGETTGAEVSVQWKPLDAWRLKAGYTWLQLHLSPDNPISRTSPQHQASLQSYLSLPWDLECNSAAYFVDEIEALFGSGSVHIPAYVRLDVGLTWRPSASFEAGIWGYNLLDNHHAESTGLNTSLITEIPRGVLGKITLRF